MTFPKGVIFRCESCGQKTGNPLGCSKCRKKYGNAIPGGDSAAPLFCINCGKKLIEGECPSGLRGKLAQ